MGEIMRKTNRYSFWLLFIFLLLFLITACSKNDETSQESVKTTAISAKEETASIAVALVTDSAGIDDTSFNQSAWEGLQRWGKANQLTQGIGGYDYLVSVNDGEYVPNLTQLIEDEFQLIFGLGFLLADAIALVAAEYPDTMFAIVDTVVDQPNVASITFAEHEGSFLVGVAAALKTQTNKIGFIGGVDSPVIQKFEAGFRAGVHAIDPEITVEVQYADGFNDFAKGKALASNMFDHNIDIIYHAAGATGNGVIAEAKERKLANLSQDIWVIGVDRDQYAEGIYDEASGASIVYTSMVKRVDIAVKQIAQMALEGRFPGGEEIVFSLENEGIFVADSNTAFDQTFQQTVREWEKKIRHAEINVPKTRDALEQFFAATEE